MSDSYAVDLAQSRVNAYNDAVVKGTVAGTMAFYLIIGAIYVVLSVVAMWKIFTKAGQAGWKSIIPIYNLIVLCQISGLNPLTILLIFIPFVGQLIFLILLYVKLANAFGQGGGFAVGLILLNFIFMLILAFGKAEYVGPQE